MTLYIIQYIIPLVPKHHSKATAHCKCCSPHFQVESGVPCVPFKARQTAHLKRDGAGD